MKLFKCQSCGETLYFENRSCERCGSRLGYLPEQASLSAVEPDGDAWRALAAPARRYLFCANEAYDACNWLVAADGGSALCLSCIHNRTIPDLTIEKNLDHWRKIEIAKHRLLYSLLQLRLPIANPLDQAGRLAFDILAAPAEPHGKAVLIGHDDGVITLSLEEADDAYRENIRVKLGEPYRTLLGHFRHEIGHYYWDRIVMNSRHEEPCRALFGDDREDYAAALARHYEQGPRPDWREAFVSAYASAHPWEDFAETWAHYLHIVDTLELASAFGMQLRPRVDTEGALETVIDFDPYRAASIEKLLGSWLPVTFALNNLNRGMGLNDPYPFTITPKVVAKLGFIHDLIRAPRD